METVHMPYGKMGMLNVGKKVVSPPEKPKIADDKTYII